MPDAGPDAGPAGPDRTALTAEDFYARADTLAPMLRDRAAAAEAARCVPVETVDAFKAADLIRITQPARFGGHEMGWDVLCEVASRLTRGDGAQGWIQAIMSDHAQMLGTFPLQAQEDVLGRKSGCRHVGCVRPQRHRNTGRGRLPVFWPVRVRQRHRSRRLADLRRIHRQRRQPRWAAFLYGAPPRC